CPDRVPHVSRFSARASRRKRRRNRSQASAKIGGFNRPRSEPSRGKHEFADFAGNGWQSAPVRRNAECTMKPRLVVASIVVLTIAASPALAQAKKARAQCVDRPQQFSWSFILPGQPAPRPNGCSPPVYNYGKFIGQDPDPNIRLQLMRDPATGYSPL